MRAVQIFITPVFRPGGFIEPMLWVGTQTGPVMMAIGNGSSFRIQG